MPRRKAVLQVADRSYFPNTLGNAANVVFMARSTQTMRAPGITRIKFAIPNVFVAANSGTSTIESTAGVGTLTISGASIEYPIGATTRRRALFNGATSTTVAAGGVAWTDWVNVAVPQNQQFAVVIRLANSTGPCFNGVSPNFNSSLDQLDQTTTDLTITGTVTDTVGGGTVFPCAVVGESNTSALGIIGDSRQTGVGDTTVDATGYLGEVMRGLLGQSPMMNLACPGEFGTTFLANSPVRSALLKFCTHVICGYGINDLEGSVSAATLESAISAIAASVGARYFWQTTIPPASSSTDGFATVTNQTASPNNAARATFNAAVRSGLLGVDNFLEIASIMESGTTGKWNAPGFTTDGLHETTSANQQIAFSKSLITPTGNGYLPTTAP